MTARNQVAIIEARATSDVAHYRECATAVRLEQEGTYTATTVKHARELVKLGQLEECEDCTLPHDGAAR